MKKKLLTAIFSLGSMGLFGQEEYLRDVSATQNLSKTIASLFQENQIATVFGRLTPYWPMPQNEMEAIEELAEIKAALHRLDDGSYGICISCGEEIGTKRMAVRPESHECVDCANLPPI